MYVDFLAAHDDYLLEIFMYDIYRKCTRVYQTGVSGLMGAKFFFVLVPPTPSQHGDILQPRSVF